MGAPAALAVPAAAAAAREVEGQGRVRVVGEGLPDDERTSRITRQNGLEIATWVLLRSRAPCLHAGHTTATRTGLD